MGGHGQCAVPFCGELWRLAGRLCAAAGCAPLDGHPQPLHHGALCVVCDGAELGAGLAGGVFARRGADHRHCRAGAHVHDAHFLPRIGTARALSDGDVFEPHDPTD